VKAHAHVADRIGRVVNLGDHSGVAVGG
jgi:hypothetical protein